MKNKYLIITNIIVLSLVALSLLSFLIWGVYSDFHFSRPKSSLLYNETFNSNNFNRLTTNLKDFSFTIKESDNDKIYLEIYGTEKQKNSIKVDTTNNELNIKQERSTICIGFCFIDSEVILYLPSNIELDTNIKTYSGDLYINSFSPQNIKLTTISGDIKTDNLNNGTIKSTSGDIIINKLNNGTISSVSGDINISSIEKGQISTTSGDIRIDNSKELDISTTSGDIYLSRTNIINASSISGDIKLHNLTIEANSSVKTTSGDITIYLTNNAHINAKTTSGDKNIKQTDGIYELKLATTSGDITVK